MKKILFSFFFGILLISIVSASSYKLNLNQVDDKVLVNYEILLNSEKTISLNIPSDAYSISSNSNYSIQNNVLFITGDNIKLSYLTKDLLEKSNEGYYFIYREKFNFPVNQSVTTLILKEGYFAEKDKIFPSPSSISSDGSQIYISWNLSDIKQGDDFPIFLTIISPHSSFSKIIWILAVLFIFVLVYLAYDKIFKSKKHSKSPIESHLLESEKSVLHILKASDRGEIWQKQLQLKTGFSKAKLSRVIRNLESRNLVEKIPFGNTNKIRLR